MNLTILKLFRMLVFYSPLRRYFFHRYRYSFHPEQLGYFVRCLNQTRDVEGSIVEIGCGGGGTTVYLNKHMDFAGINKVYRCIDTFSGFTDEDIEFELSHRQKTRKMFVGFTVNDLAWFEYTMSLNGITRVIVKAADIKQYELPDESISFCLIDVDLYQPVLSALHKVWLRLSPGGIVIVDDCRPDNQFDGALQAYNEFIQAHGLSSKLILKKLGVVQKYL